MIIQRGQKKEFYHVSKETARRWRVSTVLISLEMFNGPSTVKHLYHEDIQTSWEICPEKVVFKKIYSVFIAFDIAWPGAHTRVKHVYLGNNVRELVFVNFHRQLKKGQYFKINSTKLRNLAEILFLSLFSQWNPQNESCRKEFCDKIIFLMKAVFLKKFKNVLIQFG